MASTPRVSSRVAGTFAAGQVIVVASLPNRGPLNPSEGNAAVVAPAGQRPRAGTAATCAHETTPAETGTGGCRDWRRGRETPRRWSARGPRGPRPPPARRGSRAAVPSVARRVRPDPG